MSLVALTTKIFFFITLYNIRFFEAAVFNYPNALSIYSRNAGLVENLECVEFKSLDGIYYPATPASPSSTACGLYLVGEVNTRVKIEFLDFNVACASGHLLGVLDGWEQNGNIFPPAQDLTLEATQKRYSTFCGTRRPRKTFYSSGNFALIPYKLGSGDHFIVQVTFEENPTPCNAVALEDEGQFELRNYAKQSNCSVMIIHPQQVLVSFMDVGRKQLNDEYLAPNPQNLFIFDKGFQREGDNCDLQSYPTDYVEILGGNGWAVPDMYSFGPICGRKEIVGPLDVLCETTVVRLVSSGHYENMAVVEHAKPQLLSGTRTNTRTCPALFKQF